MILAVLLWLIEALTALAILMQLWRHRGQEVIAYQGGVASVAVGLYSLTLLGVDLFYQSYYYTQISLAGGVVHACA